ncbi:MAG: hypothetical protein JWP12_3145 [Bacteroidetes bacterium]|nr:hypothetical protein [Bacteroidota bacterium]
MKKQLLIASLMLAAGTGVFAQTSGRNFTPVTVNNITRPVTNHDRNTTCTADTLRYALIKEYALNATPAFNAAPINPGEEQSQAFISPGTVNVTGIDFRARVNSANAAAIVPVKVYLYSVDAAYKPLARLDSASLTVATTVAKYYHANFSSAHAISGNYAVAVASTATGTIKFDFIANDRDAGTGGEGLSYNRWNPGTGLTWFANADATSGWGQDFDADISPIVSYAINTNYTVSATTVCTGTALTFTNTTTPMNTLSSKMYNYNTFVYSLGGSTQDSTFAWDMDDASPIIWSPATTTYTYAAAGTYNATLYTLSGFWNSCTDTKVSTITVLAAPVLAITSPAAVCSPATVDITASGVTAGSTGGGTLSYYTNAAATMALSTPNAVSASGTYYIKADNGTCSDLEAVIVTINATSDATITTAPASICANATAVTLNAATSGGTWSGTGITNSSTGVFDPSVAGAGTYVISYTTSGTCTSTGTATIAVTAADNATITQPGMICSNAAAFTLTAATAGGTWSGTGITDVSAGTFDPATATVGANTITYTTAGACPDADAITITVSVCTGIQNYDNASAVNVYPNPSSTGVFTVDLGTAEKSILEVYNVVGASVFAKQFNTQVISLELNDFKTGVYFLKVTTDKGQITKKITITK